MKLPKTALIIAAVLIFGCKEVPFPPEVLEAQEQEQNLWRAGAPLYFSLEYSSYLTSLNLARKKFRKETLKLGWLRNYGDVSASFRDVLAEGGRLLDKLKSFAVAQESSLQAAAVSVRNKITTLDEITLGLGERGEGRQGLARAGIALREAESLLDRGKYEDAARKLAAAEEATAQAKEAVIAHIGRYLDSSQVKVWRKWAEDTIAESKQKGTMAIIVSKLERKLTVYKKGDPIRTYNVGLGFNGLLTKTRSGDNATPEGKYRILRKNPRSQYHKALLINYPNEEDKKRFNEARREGRIPLSATIGGNIEIHGGGKGSLTEGCVSMDNDQMDELFSLIAVGTPVTIVGTLEFENFVIKAIGAEK